MTPHRTDVAKREVIRLDAERAVLHLDQLYRSRCCVTGTSTPSG
jgi:hypothetical protein